MLMIVDQFDRGPFKGDPGIQGTSNNTNSVGTMDTPFANDPPTLADMEAMRAKMNELILALRR